MTPARRRRRPLHPRTAAANRRARLAALVLLAPLQSRPARADQLLPRRGGDHHGDRGRRVRLPRGVRRRASDLAWVTRGAFRRASKALATGVKDLSTALQRFARRRGSARPPRREARRRRRVRQAHGDDRREARRGHRRVARQGGQGPRRAGRDQRGGRLLWRRRRRHRARDRSAPRPTRKLASSERTSTRTSSRSAIRALAAP